MVAQKIYNIMLGLKVQARSKGEALNLVWNMIPDSMKPVIDWVTGGEIADGGGWMASIRKQFGK